MTKPDLLFLAHRIPYPPNKGEKIRAWHFLRGLAQHYTIHLGALVDDIADLADIGELESITKSRCLVTINAKHEKIKSLRGLLTGQALTVPFFYNDTLADYVKSFASGHPTAPVFLYSSGMAGYVKHLPSSMPVLVDLVDMDSAKWKEYATKEKFPMSFIYGREAEKLLGVEAELVKRSKASFFVSQAERDLFLETTITTLSVDHQNKVHSLENGVDLDYFSPTLSFDKPDCMKVERPYLVFTGAMDYAPNRDAVVYMVKEILPLVHAKGFSDCHFVIVGSKPAADVMALKSLNVTVTGRVPDVRPYLACADVAVAPMRIARGVQNKVLEAMAMGKAVITTPQGFEGIVANPETDAVVCDTADSFADKVVALLKDKQHAETLGQSARTQMETHYGWSAKQALLLEFIK